MSSTSYITISAFKVRQAAEKYLERSEKNRNARKEKIIDRYRQKRTWFGFGRQLTEEEARARSAYELVDNSIMGGYWDGRAEDIIRMCKISDVNEITLSADDVKLLKEFL